MTIWKWFGRHPSTPKGDELKDTVMSEKSQFAQLRDENWTFHVEKSNDGTWQPVSQTSIPNAILQDIREDQKMVLKELKANTKANQELLAYLKQVFG